MKIVSLLTATALMLSAGSVAATPTQLLTFEGLTSATDVPVPQGYGGLFWDNFTLADPLNYNGYPPAFFNGVISPTYVAYSDGTGAVIAGGLHFQDAYFTAGLSDATTLTILGITGNDLVWEQSVTLNTEGPTRVIFTSPKYVAGALFFASTGTGADQAATYFTLDDLRFNAVPEPAAWGLMLTGVGVIGAVARRRRGQLAAA